MSFWWHNLEEKKNKIKKKSKYSSESGRGSLKITWSLQKMNFKIILYFFEHCLFLSVKMSIGIILPASSIFGLGEFDDRRCTDTVMWIFCTSCLLNKWPTQNFTLWFVIYCERSVATAKVLSLILYPLF